MIVQGSNISRSYNTTSKNDTVVKQSDTKTNGTSTLSNKPKITGVSSSAGKKVDSGYGKSAFITYSENLKKQSNGLRAAAANAKDGADLVKTADSALQEAESVLKRMKEITSQAKKENLSDFDRSILQNEIDDLSSQIDEISSTTSYNGINLLDGDGSTKVVKAETIEETTTTTQTTIPASFNSNGNSFYAKNGTTTLSDEDALKELQSGNSLYLDAAKAQTAYKNDGSNVSEGSQSYSINIGASSFKFTSIVTQVDSNNDGNYKQSTVKNNELGIDSNTNITVDELVEKLNANQKLNANFTFEKTSDTSLTVTAKETKNAYMSNFKYKIGSESKETTGTDAINLYELGGTTALDSATANSKLANGETLYINAASTQTVAKNNEDYTYTPAKTIITETKTTTTSQNAEDSSATESYKTLNFNLNSDGSYSKLSSVRLDRMDADAIGVSDLSVQTTTDAEKSGDKIDSALEQVGKQREYLENVGSRLREASTTNNKNADNVETGQKINAKNEPAVKPPEKDVYVALEQTILENSTKATEQSLEVLGTTAVETEEQ